MAKKKTPSNSPLVANNLSFARSLQVAEGFFYATRAGDCDEARRMPVAVIQRGMRGQTSHPTAKLPERGGPTIQTLDHAAVPPGFDGIELTFSTRVMPMCMRPHACSIAEVGRAYSRLARGYHEAGGFRVLAELYAWNIANGRFAWRNRFMSDEMEVRVSFGGTEIAFDPLELPIDAPADLPTVARAMTKGDEDDLEEFVAGIVRGLSRKSFAFETVWAARMLQGQEIFPSQEYIREEGRKKGYNKILSKIPTFVGDRLIDQASMHSTKIGAALRHVDIWHGSDEHGAIPANPYGGVQETGDVLRKDDKSLYTIRKKAEELFEIVENATSVEDLTGDVHFMMANLVRGGVYGEKPDGEKEDA